MLRKWWNNTNLELEAEYAEAAGLMVAFREGFQEPLRRVTMGVRSMVATENAPVIVSQRLKRAVTIVHKLSRLQSTRLSQMQDIGGCRAILPDREHVERVVRRMRRNSWEIKALDDYWLNPKPTGYRAVHVVVERMGRLVEVQLRTPLQQRWAEEVDRVGGRIGRFLKDGQGPPELLRYFELVAEAAHLRESGEPADEWLMAEIEALEEAVASYFDD